MGALRADDNEMLYTGVSRCSMVFVPPKMSHSFTQNCWIALQVLHHEGWKTCVKMEGKTNFKGA